ncbi:hypothetical protein BLNAU_9755 [Blattamonas nauphoetae]|uniref:Uncharacterized protein n=1 Tax=Blattamonas nauphoetae TaxID=2049346 RepID=A0ABQ9XV66_9EUKA|nr:hypothetical protein BLNAU_9755 [Blattamonas nauphoetae]
MDSSPPYAVVTTLARISLIPHLGIAAWSLEALFPIVERDPSALTRLPSRIFPRSSPYQQYSGLSFLAAVQKKLRIVFSEFQANLPTNPSHLPKYLEFTKDDPYIITHSLDFCRGSLFLPTFLLNASPRIEVDSEIIRDLFLFVKESLHTILTNMSNIDNLIASLASNSSPTIPLIPGVHKQMTDSLHILRNQCELFVNNSWCFFKDLTSAITDLHKNSFQTILLDDPSFPDLILNSLKLNHKDIRRNTLMALTTIVVDYPSMRERFMTVNLVGRMYEIIDFVSLPLSESNTLLELTIFIACMFCPIGDDLEAHFEQYRLIRVSVFEPAKQFLTFLFNNSDKLIQDEEHKSELEYHLCWIHHHFIVVELQSDEHNSDIVSELVKWEVRTMVEMENEEHFELVFQNMLGRTQEWNEVKRERQKRREVFLREEGWDDAFELRVVGIEADMTQQLHRKQMFESEIAQRVVGCSVSRSSNHDSGTGMMSPNLEGTLVCLNTFSSCIRQRNADLETTKMVSFTLRTFKDMTVAAGNEGGEAAINILNSKSSLTVRTESSLSVRTGFFQTCIF